MRITSYKDLAQKLLNNDNFVILTHKSPDGDCLGAGFALCYFLRGLGKRANVLNSDGVPKKFEYLAREYEEQKLENEFVMSVDVADTKLLGEKLEHYADKVSLCIDHHGSNKDYAKEMYLDADASAACLIVWELLCDMGAEPSGIIAECLYTGLATDTGCFMYENAGYRTHVAAANLIKAGVNAAKINREMFIVKSKGRIAAETELMGNLKFFENDSIAVMVVKNELMARTGLDRAELDGIAPLPMTVEGVKVGLTFKQQEDSTDTYKVSVRTVEADASAIALQFDGGGHSRAAGFTVLGELDELILRAVNAVKRFI
ncbi:MAG: bifunctional oligoribonuclease/PAP phosphatase NrnA [Oscillospiraceae bacterium]|nr:bifunctional oligoribonuclease/PAP phosphatase NrnA [Oscillospiraceae bacterium]